MTFFVGFLKAQDLRNHPGTVDQLKKAMQKRTIRISPKTLARVMRRTAPNLMPRSSRSPLRLNVKNLFINKFGKQEVFEAPSYHFSSTPPSDEKVPPFPPPHCIYFTRFYEKKTVVTKPRDIFLMRYIIAGNQSNKLSVNKD